MGAYRRVSFREERNRKKRIKKKDHAVVFVVTFAVSFCAHAGAAQMSIARTIHPMLFTFSPPLLSVDENCLFAT